MHENEKHKIQRVVAWWGWRERWTEGDTQGFRLCQGCLVASTVGTQLSVIILLTTLRGIPECFIIKTSIKDLKKPEAPSKPVWLLCL